MRVVVLGATGNVGTSLLQSLAGASEVDEIVGVARRRPRIEMPRVRWEAADIRSADLASLFAGADAVVHLAWVLQPSHRLRAAREINVDGSARVFGAVADAGVPTLVYASSVGAYSRGPKDRAVDEAWPTDGIPTSFYSRHKAEVERLLDRFERDRPGVRVVRLRPGLIFKREAGSGIRRLFAGPLLPAALVRPSLIPAVPDVPGLRFQAVHSYDVGDAYRLAVLGDVRGAFNVAAEPVLDPATLARVLHARRVRVPARALRTAAALTWRLHLQPSPPGWIDLALGVPLMDTGRARSELGWTPRYSSTEALTDLLQGIRDGAGYDTPPLAARTSGRLRSRELATGVGESER